MKANHIVIAIDGPAASGKSSVAKLLGRKLGFLYVNSGAMYRAVTWLVLQKGVNPADEAAVYSLLAKTQFECGSEANESTLRLNGRDPGPFLCDNSVNQNVSTIATLPEVRRLLVEKQREYLCGSDLVMEGRDIGSVVFPQTPYKFYIDASPEVRQRRRALQGQQDEVAARDRSDSSRKNSPLTIAEDALVIDSSNLTIEGVVGEIIGRLRIKGFPVNL